MKKNITKLIILAGVISLTACKDKDNDNKTLYDFQNATNQAQQDYLKDKTKGFKDFLKEYNLDETFVLANAVVNYRKDAILEVSSSSGMSDAVKKADEKLKSVKISDVIKEFNKNNPDAPVIRKSMTYKDGYTRDLPLAYTTMQIPQSELQSINKCFSDYRTKYIKIDLQDIKKTQAEMNKFNNTKISEVLSKCNK